ncbi:unnamed protein product, partial [Ectocarpus sp. 12 AP-2014]
MSTRETEGTSSHVFFGDSDADSGTGFGEEEENPFLVDDRDVGPECSTTTSTSQDNAAPLWQQALLPQPPSSFPVIVPSLSGVETEVETENEDSGNEYDDGQGRVAPAAAAAATSTAAGGEEEQQQWWANLIVQQLHQSDPHAMRQLLRKAAFIPAFLRKDVWRLLILGRVEAGGGKDEEGDVAALDAAILSTDLDLENQRVVRVDVERTRPALDQFKRPRVKNLLARILTYHCKTHGLGYKQGMHEVLAPFVALSDPELPTSDISLCYSAFLRRFLPYAFNQDEEFLSLQICFRLFRLLLLYHHPRLCRFLDQYQLQPELYATPWFMTLFSNSLDLPRLYEVWDFYLYWGDPALHHFVVLAFVIGNAEAILKAEEANLPETMCRLTDGMRSVEEVRALMRTAKDLMLNTPKSFRKILRSALYANLSQSQMNLVLNTLQVSSCIPVSAEEITSYVLHKNPHRQLDQESDGDEESVLDDAIASASGTASDAATGRRDCNGGGGGGDGSHSLKSRRNDGRGAGGGGPGRASPSPQRRAERAAMRSLRVHRQYIILDCRPRGEFESCRLAPALHLDPDLLTSPEKLDAKLKEFMPLQSVAHFCLVGAGDDDMGAVGQRKNTSSDLSGEAMGLRTVSNSKSDSPGRAGLAGEVGFLADRGGSGDMFSKPEGGFGRDSNSREGGFLGGFSRALSRGYGHAAAAGKDGEEEIGREEDVQVTRLVLMLLQYNFPFISHVRGDMAAILEELSAQALAEKEGQHADNGDFHETLHGALIGADSDRVREQLMHISPEKTSKGLFAGLSKWSKKDDKPPPPSYASKGGGLGSATAGSKGGKAADGDDPASLGKKNADATAASSRGRGGLGRRDTEDFYMVTKPQDHSPAAERKSSKRRLFGGVMDRFDNNNSNNNNNNARADGDAASSSSSSLAGAARKQPWLLSPGRSSREARQEAPGREPPRAAAAPSSVLEASAAAEGKQKTATTTATATWTKPAARKRDTPDRLANFFGKILGVKDDALPDRPIDLPPGGGAADEATRARSPTTSGVAAAGATGAPTSAAGGGATGAPSSGEPRASESFVSSSDAAAGSGAAAAAAAAASTAETPLATAVYSATTVSAATADAMPVAVAVAVPLSDPAAPARRPSRSSRTDRTRAAAGGGSRSEGEVVLEAGTGRVVSIRDWIAKEERENGGAVRVFSAQRVLDGKVQKKCRLAVSRKSLTQVRCGAGQGSAWADGHRGVWSRER